MGKDKIKVEHYLELQRLAAIFEDLAAGLREGVIRAVVGGESVVLTPPSVVEVEIKVERKKDEAKFSLEMSWEVSGKAAERELLFGRTGGGA